ncbi:rRNA adenine N-6-methyltransferase family protein [Pseudactinotalea sp. Z1739]|uniref:rRNA adenine N-6-methyltransferase family protein n=1 Tax=Pseudactinotalea sp. Z1739 TaxID=3413028 RepID=UPI003C7B8043
MSGNGRRGAWGWHPLRPDWAQRIVAESGVGAGDLVFDLGAGNGALTLPLIASGAEVVAIELHPERVEELRARVAGRARVVQADLREFYVPGRPFRVVANPPFALTTHLVRTLLAARGLRSADLVLQRGAARGLSRRPPVPARSRCHARQGRGRQWKVGVGRHLPGAAFVVPPSVDAAVLQIRR